MQVVKDKITHRSTSKAPITPDINISFFSTYTLMRLQCVFIDSTPHICSFSSFVWSYCILFGKTGP